MSTIDKGVDVLDTIQKFVNYFDRGSPMSLYAAWNRELIETKLRIAELIEAADDVAKYGLGSESAKRLAVAVAACRVTPDPPA